MMMMLVDGYCPARGARRTVESTARPVQKKTTGLRYRDAVETTAR